MVLHHGVIDNTPYGKVYSVVTVYNAIQSAMLEYILRNSYGQPDFVVCSHPSKVKTKKRDPHEENHAF